MNSEPAYRRPARSNGPTSCFLAVLVFGVLCLSAMCDAAMVEEKLDEFDQTMELRYTGSKVELPDSTEVRAAVVWKNGKLNKPHIMMMFSRLTRAPHWVDRHEVQMLVDKQPVVFEGQDYRSRGLDMVSEIVGVSLSPEAALQILAAEQVRIRIGPDEWTWNESHKLPLMAVMLRWMNHGADLSGYRDLLARILRPQKGERYEDVVKKHGAPVWKEAETGWATWKAFWLRFEKGAVVESRPRPAQSEEGIKKAAQ